MELAGGPRLDEEEGGASSGRGGSDYMVDAILSCQLLHKQRHEKAVKPQRNRQTDGWKHPLTRMPAEQA